MRLKCFKKIIAAVISAAVLFLSACSQSEKKTLNYEQPVASFKGSLNAFDETAYLCCFLPQEKARFLSSDSYSEGFLEDELSKHERIGGIGIKISDSRELSREELDKLEEEYKEGSSLRLEFTKGQQLDLDFIMQKKNGPHKSSCEMTVVRYENVWYIYGDVIDSFSFLD